MFAGYVVLGVTGFGSALFIVPLLSWKWPLPQVVVLVLLLDIPASIVFGSLNRKHVALREIGGLLPGMVAGSVLGFWLHGAVAPHWPLLGLGCYIVVVGLRALSRTVPGPAPDGRWRHLVGAGAGFIEVMFATAGPVVLAWFRRRLDGVQGVRASTPSAMVVCASIALALMAGEGALASKELWLRFFSFFFVAAMGVVLGNRLARHVSVTVLARLVSSLLVASGATLAIRATL